MIVINYAQICFPCIVMVVVVPVLCLCLPCLVRLLVRLHGGPLTADADGAGAPGGLGAGRRKGASPEQIAGLPLRSYAEYVERARANSSRALSRSLSDLGLGGFDGADGAASSDGALSD